MVKLTVLLPTSGAGGSWAFFAPGEYSISLIHTGFFVFSAWCNPHLQHLHKAVSEASAKFKP